jgi:hypothetical protein
VAPKLDPPATPEDPLVPALADPLVPAPDDPLDPTPPAPKDPAVPVPFELAELFERPEPPVVAGALEFAMHGAPHAAIDSATAAATGAILTIRRILVVFMAVSPPAEFQYSVRLGRDVFGRD